MPFYSLSKQYLTVVKTGIARASGPGILIGSSTIEPKQEFAWQDVLSKFDPTIDMLVFATLTEAKTAAILFSRLYSDNNVRVASGIQQLATLVIFEFAGDIDLSKPSNILGPKILTEYADLKTIFLYYSRGVRAEMEYYKTLMLSLKMFPEHEITPPKYSLYKVQLEPTSVHFQTANGKFIKQHVTAEATFDLQCKVKTIGSMTANVIEFPKIRHKL